MIKYNLICADPPWVFSDRLTMSEVKRGAESQYSVLNIEEIKKLKISEIAADDAILALWIPSSLLQEGLDVMKAWNFRQTQTHIWVKTKFHPFTSIVKSIRKQAKELPKLKLDELYSKLFKNFDWNDMLAFNMGRLFRQSHEICLMGVRGKIYDQLKNKSQRSVHFAPNLKHSAKPEILQDRLELMFPKGKYLEVFGRRARSGWTVIGNEAPDTMGQDVRESIENLLK